MAREGAAAAEKEMATLASILAWEIPRAEEAGGLESVGLQKNQTWPSTHTTPLREAKRIGIWKLIVKCKCV